MHAVHKKIVFGNVNCVAGLDHLGVLLFIFYFFTGLIQYHCWFLNGEP